VSAAAYVPLAAALGYPVAASLAMTAVIVVRHRETPNGSWPDGARFRVHKKQAMVRK